MASTDEIIKNSPAVRLAKKMSKHGICGRLVSAVVEVGCAECDWTGYEDDLKLRTQETPSGGAADSYVCPDCGSDDVEAGRKA